MKKILTLLLTIVAFSGFAQESLEPLRYNAALQRAGIQEKVGALHGTFIYSFDTLSLPFIDDFSQDHFEPFNAQAGDANVSDTTWFHIVNGGNPEPMGTIYMLDTTYKYEIDTVPGHGTDSFTVDTIPLTSLTVDLYDLSDYLVTVQNNVEVWPAMVIFDTLYQTSTSEDTLIEVNPDIEQDSMTIYFVDASNSNVYWEDRYAYRNDNYPIDPVSIGVATFDGLDENGYPYDWSSASAYGIADYLTSKPIDLSPYTIADSIYLSFLYQPGGLGENPESGDSLVLEFWSPTTGTWNHVWSTGGFTSSDFEIELYKLMDPQYLQNGFQFRFLNYGSLTGSLDHWHLDYVMLDRFMEYDDTLMLDWAYQYPVHTLLKEYTSVPWPHYEFDPYGMMLDSVKAYTYNSSNQAVFIDPCTMDLFYEGGAVNTINYVVNPSNAPALSQHPMKYDIPSNFFYDTILADTCAVFDTRFFINTNTANSLDENDTLFLHQEMCNYYSYDDGSAEAAYGIQGAGAELAYQFTLPAGLSDTIRAVYMHFSASVNDMSQEPFFIQIWDDNGAGEPGSLIYTTDDQNLPVSYVPQYNIGVDGFYEYVLPEQIELTGTFYVGWKQSTPDRMNIGFDKNINHQDKIFYDIGTGFTSTGFEGSLMMRPVFVSDKDALSVSIEEKKEHVSFKVYPNPANDMVQIDVDEPFQGTVRIFDLQGKNIYTNRLVMGEPISISNLSNGLYLVQLESEDGVQSVQKLSVRH